MDSFGEAAAGKWLSMQPIRMPSCVENIRVACEKAQKCIFWLSLADIHFKTGDFLGSIVENLKMLFTGKVGIDQMMGPVGISSVVSQTTGFVDFIYMLAIISISLGVTNLLPIPALDGGKLLILLIEAIRRKPMKEELEIGIQLAGFIILISLSIFISYKDILRIF